MFAREIKKKWKEMNGYIDRIDFTRIAQVDSCVFCKILEFDYIPEPTVQKRIEKTISIVLDEYFYRKASGEQNPIFRNPKNSSYAKGLIDLANSQAIDEKDLAIYNEQLDQIRAIDKMKSSLRSLIEILKESDSKYFKKALQKAKLVKKDLERVGKNQMLTRCPLDYKTRGKEKDVKVQV